MSAPEMFGVVVISTGFLMMLRGFYGTCSAVESALRRQQPHLRRRLFQPTLFQSLILLGLGAVCLWQASQIVKLCYKGGFYYIRPMPFVLPATR